MAPNCLSISARVVATVLLSLLTTAGASSPITGTWKGESICVADKTVCRDEVVIYDISGPNGSAGEHTVSADKIVNGERLHMGDLTCKTGAEENEIVCSIPRGVWRFRANGKKLTATLTLTDGTVFRRAQATKAD